jgi:DNA-binding beta-propeller fold protein YncE
VAVFNVEGEYIASIGGTKSSSSRLGAFSYPRGIAISPTTGRLHVIDAGNNRIQVLQ